LLKLPDYQELIIYRSSQVEEVIKNWTRLLKNLVVSSALIQWNFRVALEQERIKFLQKGIIEVLKSILL